ncbi:nitrogenase iron-molybdenum cofactor biosynthesis protein NifE [Thiospirochaeta perfilievii]|uniref:Nitrogenase iron-molybdenum cofactor biosynthesis protein NifE n=1 Tax=Thiospirochaeta perfilievii TaxID=252967 RepID=A0A5C1QEF2_9SPIO|nr:nitrogenase iron-molybdenum cofactor biosynthesis protein NifE [Thiospirochaeta perfilievii]QEN04592.1 nitrogenase iron-molybdenum cofactor biosynthesis protein NifE [Thiospirochaeta perfilievii]
MSSSLLNERKDQVWIKSEKEGTLTCDKESLAGAVSQRACVFCGSRVVLYPVADALHIVHGPIGCASFTWDIRGSLSSGPELHRLSFSTDLKEKDVVFGGEKKLERALLKLIEEHKPKATFVFATCITGIIGDDIGAVCKKVGLKVGIPVIPVHSEGFKGTKKDGYKAACDALAKIVGTGDISQVPKLSINILGEFNLAGEAWMIQKYYEQMGIEVVSILTGDGRVEKISKSHGASLNVVQCSGSLSYLAKQMEEDYGIPYKRVSYFGIEDMSKALYDVADFFSDYPGVREKAESVVRDELSRIIPEIEKYKRILAGKRAAVYVGGAFKAFSLIKALKLIGMSVVIAGSQTGNREDYEQLKILSDPGCIIVDDSNPLELSDFVIAKRADLFIGGVKERPIAFKLGIGFCDHNHERKIALAGYKGMINFFKEVHDSVMSPVWNFSPRKFGQLGEIL